MFLIELPRTLISHLHMQVNLPNLIAPRALHLRLFEQLRSDPVPPVRPEDCDGHDVDHVFLFSVLVFAGDRAYQDVLQEGQFGVTLVLCQTEVEVFGVDHGQS